MLYPPRIIFISVVIDPHFYKVDQERLGVLAAPRKARSTFIIARLRSAVPVRLIVGSQSP